MPYMLDPRHPEDTVFLFFEADFRFYKRDCIDPEQWLPMVAGNVYLQPGGAGRPSGSSAVLQIQDESEDDAVAAASAAGCRERRWYRHMEARQGLREEDRQEERVSQELVDMVLTMNEAHRHNAGDLVWFSWNAGGMKLKKRQRATHPDHGSFAIGFTRPAARILQEKMPNNQPQLFDLWLLHNLVEGPTGELRDVMASYVCPPIGGYSEHFTLVLGGEGGTREAHWDAKWASEGSVSTKKGGYARQLGRFSKKGPLDAVVDLDIPKKGLHLALGEPFAA